MQWEKVTLVEEDGDPLRYGTAVIWAPCQKYLLGHQETTALNDTHGDSTLLFARNPEKGQCGGQCV